MESILGTAHTWFLESYRQGPYGDLLINLVEGIKNTERRPVHIGAKVLGPYFPITIEPHSRCAVVRFRDLRGLFTYTEGYDAEDSRMSLSEGKFIRRVESSSFRDFAAATTTAIEAFRGEYSEWLVWTEEQVFQVLAGEPPEICLDERAPDFSIERGKTWSAS